MTHILSSADISILSPGISNFCYINKYRYRLHFNTYFLILLTLFDSLKVVFKCGFNFDDVSKFGYSGLS